MLALLFNKIKKKNVSLLLCFITIFLSLESMEVPTNQIMSFIFAQNFWNNYNNLLALQLAILKDLSDDNPVKGDNAFCMLPFHKKMCEDFISKLTFHLQTSNHSSIEDLMKATIENSKNRILALNKKIVLHISDLNLLDQLYGSMDLTMRQFTQEKLKNLQPLLKFVSSKREASEAANNRLGSQQNQVLLMIVQKFCNNYKNLLALETNLIKNNFDLLGDKTACDVFISKIASFDPFEIETLMKEITESSRYYILSLYKTKFNESDMLLLSQFYGGMCLSIALFDQEKPKEPFIPPILQQFLSRSPAPIIFYTPSQPLYNGLVQQRNAMRYAQSSQSSATHFQMPSNSQLTQNEQSQSNFTSQTTSSSELFKRPLPRSSSNKKRKRDQTKD